MIFYLIQTLLCWTLFFGLYVLLLKKSTFFKFNRLYILISAVLSVVVPALNISIDVFGVNAARSLFEIIIIGTQKLMFVNLLKEIVVTAPISHHVDWQWIIINTYIFGIFIFILRFVFHYKKIQILREAAKYKVKEGIGIFIHTKAYVPFSFLNKIYIANSDYESSGFLNIFHHEKIHITRHHYIDMMLFELFCCFFWFNPFVWLMKKELQYVHEYFVDDILLRGGEIDNVDYQLQILRYATNLQLVGINSFANPTLKMRLLMMGKDKSKTSQKLRFLIIIPTFILLTAAFSFDMKNKILPINTSSPSPITVEANSSIDSLSNDVKGNKQAK